jgi:hypothetical protein
VVGPLAVEPAVVGPFAAPPADGPFAAELAGALAGAAALAAGFAGADGFFSWALTIEEPSSSTATMPVRYRCAFMKFSFNYWTSVTLPFTNVTLPRSL